jgi:hypothetical protein
VALYVPYFTVLSLKTDPFQEAEKFSMAGDLRVNNIVIQLIHRRTVQGCTIKELFMAQIFELP